MGRHTLGVVAIFFLLLSLQACITPQQSHKAYGLIVTQPYELAETSLVAKHDDIVYKQKVRPALTVALDDDVISKVKNGKNVLSADQELYLTQTPTLKGVTFCAFQGTYRGKLFIPMLDSSKRVCLQDTDLDKKFDRSYYMTEPAPDLVIGGGIIWDLETSIDPPIAYHVVDEDKQADTFVALQYSTSLLFDPVFYIVSVSDGHIVSISDERAKLKKSEGMPQVMSVGGVKLKILTLGGQSSDGTELGSNGIEFSAWSPNMMILCISRKFVQL